MARWIAFDQATTSLLRTALAQGTRIDTLLRGPVDYALARPSAVVVAVLPAPGSNPLGIAVFRRPRAAAAQQAAAAVLQGGPMTQPMTQPVAHRAATRAGGFLGLSDEPTFEEDAPQKKKGWWRKFWDD